MRDFLYRLIFKKKILLLGFGMEGQSTYKTLRKYFPDYFFSIADKDENILNKTDIYKKDRCVHFILGKDYLQSVNDFDLIIKTPGISLNSIPISIDKDKITSQTNIFLNLYSKQIIGITGTKGKSTTSSLIFNIIHSYTKNSILVGNIGIPPFDMIDNIDDKTIIVSELSSHQLEYISKSPHIAILLNLFQEHLDHYKGFQEYQLSKFNITRYQHKNDYFIFHKDDLSISTLLDKYKIKSQILPFSHISKLKLGAYFNKNSIRLNINNRVSFLYTITNNLYLKGHHNLLNIMAAIIACKIKKIPDGYIQEGVTNFKGLEHRIEYIGKYNDILYYDDSIATVPEATIEAVKTLKKVNTIILGGFDRGINYSDLAWFLINTKIKHLIFIEEAGIRILSELKKLKNISSQEYFSVDNFNEAIKIAKVKTKKNSICLLSPAAASYGMFKNFEERGNLFKQLIMFSDNNFDKQ